MLCFEHQGREMRIAHVTLHMSVGNALRTISKERVLRTIRAVHKFLKNPRIAIGGVNPHAGEAGALPRQEVEIVAAAPAPARSDGITADGPIRAHPLLRKHSY